MTENEIASIVLNKAFDIHKGLCPGLLESAYQKCLLYELKSEGLIVEKEVGMAINYKDLVIEYGYRLDLLVENKIVIELKAVEEILDKHEAQLLTYLRLGNYKLGLLLNFN